MLLPIHVKAQTHEKNLIFSPNYNLPAPIETHPPAQAVPRAKISRYGGNCVYYAQNYLFGRINLGWGIGGRSLPLTYTPQVNSVVVFTYAHVAVITSIANGILTLSESNYVHGQITTTRQISVTDKTIRGFYTP